MKKRLLIFPAILTALAVTLSGCGKSEIQSPEDTAPAADTTQGVVTTPAPSNDTETNEEPNSSIKDLKEGEAALLSKGKFSYGKYTMTIPEEWDQSVYVGTFEDEIIFYQAMSYDMEKDAGFVCGICQADNQIGIFAGEQYLAYSDDYFYFMSYPTGVSFMYEDPEVAGDYEKIGYAAEKMVDSIVIDDPTVRYDPKDYICPMSSLKPIPEEVFYDITGDNLKKAKEEIYARHGQFFNDPVQYYFDSCPWYKGTVYDELTQKDFNEVEWDNITLLNEKIEEWEKENTYPKFHKGNEVTKETLNQNQGEVRVGYSIELDDEYGYVANFTIDKQKYSTRDFGIELKNPDDSCYYITNMAPYYEGKEIAFLDFAQKDFISTYFFTVNDDCEFVFIGCLDGCPFTDAGSGFDEPGTVKVLLNTRILGPEAFLVNYWYDPRENKFTNNNMYRDYEMVPSPGKITKEPLTIYKEYQDGTRVTTDIETGTEVYFLSTNNRDRVTLRTKDGRQGILDVTPDMISYPAKYFKLPY